MLWKLEQIKLQSRYYTWKVYVWEWIVQKGDKTHLYCVFKHQTTFALLWYRAMVMKSTMKWIISIYNVYKYIIKCLRNLTFFYVWIDTGRGAHRFDLITTNNCLVKSPDQFQRQTRQTFSNHVWFSRVQLLLSKFFLI